MLIIDVSGHDFEQRKGCICCVSRPSPLCITLEEPNQTSLRVRIDGGNELEKGIGLKIEVGLKEDCLSLFCTFYGCIVHI